MDNFLSTGNKNQKQSSQSQAKELDRLERLLVTPRSNKEKLEPGINYFGIFRKLKALLHLHGFSLRFEIQFLFCLHEVLRYELNFQSRFGVVYYFSGLNVYTQTSNIKISRRQKTLEKKTVPVFLLRSVIVCPIKSATTAPY